MNVTVFRFPTHISLAVLLSLRLNTFTKTMVLIWNSLTYQFLVINRLIVDRLSILFLSSLSCVCVCVCVVHIYGKKMAKIYH